MIVVTVKVDWGQETIQEILPELWKHVEITLQEPGCVDFFFAIDVNNPDIVIATEVYKDYRHTTTSKLRNGDTSAESWRNTRHVVLM